MLPNFDFFWDGAIQKEELTIKCSKVKKLIGILIDYCDTHVENVCKKDHRRINALTGITIYLELLKRRISGYADNTPLVVRDNIAHVINALEEIGEDRLNGC